MEGTIAITDYGWYDFLRKQKAVEEVNFWTPFPIARGGKVTLTLMSLGSGKVTLTPFDPYYPHTITATYSGDTNNASSTTNVQVSIYSLAWLPAILELILN